MDLIYLSENFSPVDVRSQSYGFYDRAVWNFNSDDNSITVAEKHRLANLERQKQQQQKSTKNTQPCLLCLESKRRKLGNYIRQKSCEEGCIEEEEEDGGMVGHEHEHSYSTESKNRRNTRDVAVKTKG